MVVRWTKQAQAQLSEIYAYIASDNGDAAERQLEAISAAVLNLVRFPDMGRQGRVAGTRELVVQGTPYIVAYNSVSSSLGAGSLHEAQRWPRSLDEVE